MLKIVKTQDSLVIRAMLANYEVARIFVDLESFVNVLFKESIDHMWLGEYKIEHGDISVRIHEAF